MWRMLPTNNVFTLEASFCGPNIGPNANNHYRIEDYHRIGVKLCQSILIYAKIECPSLVKYLEAKEKEEAELQEKLEQESKENLKTEASMVQKSQNNLPVFKPSKIFKFQPNSVGKHYHPLNTLKNPKKIENNVRSSHIMVNEYESLNKNSQSQALRNQVKKPFLKLKTNKESERGKSVPPLEAPKITNVLRSLDTNVLLEEFKQKNLEESENEDKTDSEYGDTTSGSESNYDNKELNKILPKSFKQKKIKHRKTKGKYYSLRSQRQNSKGERSEKRISSLHKKTISRSESYNRRKGKNSRVNHYTSNLCKSTNNIQDRISQ